VPQLKNVLYFEIGFNKEFQTIHLRATRNLSIICTCFQSGLKLTERAVILILPSLIETFQESSNFLKEEIGRLSSGTASASKIGVLQKLVSFESSVEG